MSGKQAKRNKRREKELQREQARKKQRQQAIFTGIVIAIILAIGGVLIYVSLEREDPLDFAEDDPFEDELTDLDEDRPVACGAELPPSAGAEKPTFPDGPGQVIEEGLAYRAVVETSCGTVVLELDAERAPEATNSFVFLAQQGFFDGLEIFRNATSIGALQTGAGTNDASWQVGYTLTDELARAEEEGYAPGAAAMANSGPDTSGSQFFFVYNEQFDEIFAEQRVYTRFATVVEGLEVLREIGAIPVGGPTDETPTERVFIETVTIESAPGASATDAPADDPPAEDAPAEDLPAEDPATDPDEPATPPDEQEY